MKTLLRHKIWRPPLVVVVVVLVSLGMSAALANGATLNRVTDRQSLFYSPPPTPPANDNFGNAEIVTGLPYSSVVDNTQATIEPNEPYGCGWYYPSRSVWYVYTPAARELLRANMDGSSFYDTVLTVYSTANSTPGFWDLSSVTCVSYGGTVQFWAEAGVHYYFQAQDAWTGGGNLSFNLQQVPPPANDHFANATVISGLSFGENVEATAATRENDEPRPTCAQYDPAPATIWYRFTPTETQSLSAYASGYSVFEAVYTGTSFADLVEVACRKWGETMTFRAEAGTTYYFQVGNLYDPSWLSFSLAVAPPPSVDFNYWPGDPTIYDTVSFNSWCYDPANAGIEQQLWNLGDGTTTEGCCPSHRYAKDGDYSTTLTCITYDGRSGTSTKTIVVRTHDVAITRMAAPQTVKAGQTRQVSVEIRNSRYGENVRVELYKSVPYGYQQVGVLTQFVPVRPANRTTQFVFNYTFTREDAVQGKVTFRAVATILDARDALPADNEAIAFPTKVTP